MGRQWLAHERVQPVDVAPDVGAAPFPEVGRGFGPAAEQHGHDTGPGAAHGYGRRLRPDILPDLHQAQLIKGAVAAPGKDQSESAVRHGAAGRPEAGRLRRQ